MIAIFLLAFIGGWFAYFLFRKMDDSDISSECAILQWRTQKMYDEIRWNEEAREMRLKWPTAILKGYYTDSRFNRFLNREFLMGGEWDADRHPNP